MTTEVRLATGMYADQFKGHRFGQDGKDVIPTYDTKNNTFRINSYTVTYTEINFQRFEIVDKGKGGTLFIPIERPQERVLIPYGEKIVLSNGVEVENIR